MYYILGYKLWMACQSYQEKKIKADNTFLLSLDGDMDFAPKAVRLMIDTIKANNSIGSVCGRIQPTGSGKVLKICQIIYIYGTRLHICKT